VSIRSIAGRVSHGDGDLSRKHGCVSLLPPRERQRVVGGEVAGPSLEGGQVATLPLHTASVVPRGEGSILLPEGDGCAPWHKTRQSTKGAPNFRLV